MAKISNSPINRFSAMNLTTLVYSNLPKSSLSEEPQIGLKVGQVLIVNDV
ncbi:hypothetical protein [Brasilonema sp. UFV-L1]|nr:hypothetical protein [Brasilonema sp. UFV-L1]